MSKRLTFNGLQLRFPQQCLMCGQDIAKEYSISRTLTYGRRSITLTIPVPLCLQHFETASKKNQTERWIGRFGALLGALAGITVLYLLLSFWESTGQGNLFLNIFLALVVGSGAWLILWLLFGYFIAPLFGDPDSKAVRNVFKIRHYWPTNGNIQLEFPNDAIAETIAALNADRLLRKE